MEKRYLIGIDLGTTTIKAVFLDASENRIVTTEIEEIFPVKVDNPDDIEYDPGEWWDYIKKILKRGFEAGVVPEQVAGIAMCGYTVMTLLVKKDGTPLTNSIHYGDMRHIEVTDEVRELVDELTASRNFNHVGMYSCLAKIYWWKTNRPEIFNAADMAVTSVTWANYKLTGEWAFSRSEAGFYGAYNVETGDWDDEIIEKLGFRRSLFPKIVDATAVVGYVTKEAAAETGLAEGIPVFGGADDATPMSLTTGVIHAGECYITTGSGGNAAFNTEVPICHETIICYPHCIPGLTSAITIMASSGLSYKWMRNTFGQAEIVIADLAGEDAYTYLNAQAGLSRPGARGVLFLPYLDGDYTPNNDTNARGVFIGMDTATTKNDMLRAALEGVAFCILDNMMLVRSLGAEANDIKISGGNTKSPLWMQIISDVTGCPLSLPEESEGAPFGCAIMAGVGSGVFGSFEEAVERVVKIKRNAYVPDPGNHALYGELFKVYKSLYPNLKDAFSQMQDIRERYSL